MQRKHSGVVSRLEHLVLSTRQKVSSEMSDSVNTIRTQSNKIEHLERELHAAETEMNAKIKMLKWKSVNRTESMERALRAQCTSMSSLFVDAYIQTHTHTHTNKHTHKHIQVQQK